MSYQRHWVCTITGFILLAQGFATIVQAEEPLPQEMIPLPVKVVDEDDQPVAGVKIIPWALRCSQGHGSWYEGALGKCPEFVTDAEGQASTVYPRYTEPSEFIRTTEVTLSVDHPDYVFISHENVNVPREGKEPHVITIKRGGNLEILPTLADKPIDPTEIYAIWSDPRAWQKGSAPRVNSAGRLVIPSMASGAGQVLLARVENGKATHLSAIEDVELKAGETQQLELPLHPAVNVRGMISDDVPRPIKGGRVVAWTLPEESTRSKVTWRGWAPVADDGSFVIENWPAQEPIQITALCDGYIALSGEPPSVVDDRQRKATGYQRPQVFSPDTFSEPFVVKMEPLVECRVEVVDNHGSPLEGVQVVSYPNVGWWNGGSQIYCCYLFSSEKFLVTRDSDSSLDQSFPQPWSVTTDERGIAVLLLPPGKEDLYVVHDDYELPVSRGRRDVRVELVAGESRQARLVLQPKGTEFLGDWDKLAGVLFGCTGEECRRLLEDPGFRKRITAVRIQLDEAEDVNDPKLLKNAFAEISAAFDEVGDQEEVARWRRKADEQAAKLKAE